MATHAVKLTDFVKDYKQAQNKEEEAAAILEALCKVEDNTRVEIEAAQDVMMKEITLQDFATKKDLKSGLKELELSLELKLHHTVNGAKWQVIGAVAAMFFAEVILRHFGF